MNRTILENEVQMEDSLVNNKNHFHIISYFLNFTLTFPTKYEHFILCYANIVVLCLKRL